VSEKASMGADSSDWMLFVGIIFTAGGSGFLIAFGLSIDNNHTITDGIIAGSCACLCAAVATYVVCKIAQLISRGDKADNPQQQ